MEQFFAACGVFILFVYGWVLIIKGIEKVIEVFRRKKEEERKFDCRIKNLTNERDGGIKYNIELQRRIEVLENRLKLYAQAELPKADRSASHLIKTLRDFFATGNTPHVKVILTENRTGPHPEDADVKIRVEIRSQKPEEEK